MKSNESCKQQCNVNSITGVRQLIVEHFILEMYYLLEKYCLSTLMYVNNFYLQIANAS